MSCVSGKLRKVFIGEVYLQRAMIKLVAGLLVVFLTLADEVIILGLFSTGSFIP